MSSINSVASTRVVPQPLEAETTNRNQTANPVLTAAVEPAPTNGAGQTNSLTENAAIRSGQNLPSSSVAVASAPGSATDAVFRQVSPNEQRLIDRRIGQILSSGDPARDLANALGSNSPAYRAAFVSRLLQTKPDFATTLLGATQAPETDATVKSKVAGSFAEAYRAADRAGAGQQFVDQVINGLRANDLITFQQQAPLVGRLVANAGDAGLVSTFAGRALDFANTVAESPSGRVVAQGLAVAGFQAAASNPAVLRGLLTGDQLTDRVFGGLMNEAQFTGSLPSTLGQVLRTAADNGFGTDFFLRVADGLTGGEKRDARAAAVYFLNRHAGVVAERTAGSNENLFAINNLLLKTGDIRPSEAVAGANAGSLPSAFNRTEEALARFNEVNRPGTVWTMRLNVGKALGHTQINLYANGQYFGTLQGDLLGAALYTSAPNKNGTQGAVVPLSADQVRAGIEEVYRHPTPWGTWLCHDITAAAFRAMGLNDQDVYRSTPTGQGFNYVAGHLASKLLAPGTGLVLGVRELWHSFSTFVGGLGR